MQLTITKSNLLRAAKAAAGALANRSTLPILNHIALIANKQDGNVRLRCSDLEMFIDAEAVAHVIKEGSITVPGRAFMHIIEELPAEEMALCLENQTLSIKGGPSAFELRGLPIEEFPPHPKLEAPVFMEIDQCRLKEMLKLTAFAIGTDPGRYVLHGAHFKFSKNQMTIAATDGKRVAISTDHSPLEGEREAIIPKRAIAELLKLLQEEGELTCSLTAQQAHFKFQTAGGEVVLITKLIEGAFPNYRMACPALNGAGLELSTPEFRGAINRVQIITPESGTLDFKDMTLTVRSQFSNEKESFGRAEEVLSLPRAAKQDMKVAFNLEYLDAALKVLPTDMVECHFQATGPATFLARSKKWEYVVMPMQLK